jgi:subtilisin family serine protease
MSFHHWPLKISTFFFVFNFLFFYFSPLGLAAAYPSDPLNSKQWYLEKIGAYDAWTKGKGSSEIVVAVLDTGVDIDHPDLAYNIWQNKDEVIDGKDNDGNVYIDDINGWDFVDGDSDPRPDLNDPARQNTAVHHGTLVAGIIGAIGDNALGISGLNWRVKIMPLRVLDSTGQGNTDNVEEAIRYAIEKKADIINLSFIGSGFDKKLFLALRDAYRAGILVVAAVGNQTYEGLDLDNSPLYPVCYSGNEGEDVVLGVAAVDRNDFKAEFSNYGKNCVDLVAPGVDIFSTMVYKPGRGYSQAYGGGWQGTSLAAPMVSGAAALIKAVNPSLTAKEIRQILISTADPLPNQPFKEKLGYGRLNLKRAVEVAANGGLSVSGPATGLSYLIVAPFSQFSPEVRIFRENNLIKTFYAYAPQFKGGLRVVTADLDGDGIDEIITGPGPGGGPHIRIFRIDGTPLNSFFAFEKSFRGGINLSAGDLDGDGKAEIVVAPASQRGPEVRIFKANGQLLSSFYPYDKKFKGGVNVFLGDVNGDGRKEIITTPGPGLEPRVQVFDLIGVKLLNFLAFPGNIKVGVNLAFGDVDGDGKGEFIVSLMKGGQPEVRVFNAAGLWQRAFMVYSEQFKGGVSLAVGDFNQDGIDEIITGAGPGGGPHLRIFDGYGRLKTQFFPFEKNFRGGISVGIVRW